MLKNSEIDDGRRLDGKKEGSIKGGGNERKLLERARSKKRISQKRTS